MLRRNLTEVLLDALSDTPVVLVHGARQVGKSTLVRSVVRTAHPARYVTLDDASTLAAAKGDPEGFLAREAGPLAIDEVQRAPGLLLAIKASVDRDRSPGRFLLTGSANVFLLPRLSESLAGRMEILPLRPLSQGEIGGVREMFVDRVFSPSAALPTGVPCSRADLVARVLTGGFPEAVARKRVDRRDAWFQAYLSTVLQRDVRDLANIDALVAMPRLLALAAARTPGLFNASDLSRAAGMPLSTVKRYLSLLEAIFLVQMLPAWGSNRTKRLVKAPKLLLADTGLLSHLLGADVARVERSDLLGPLLENFVAVELQKQAGWSAVRPMLHHFRTSSGREADLVIEARNGDVVGVEVKAGASVASSDFNGLKEMAAVAGKKFRRGIVLYTGREAVPFGKTLDALPISCLWAP